jgi:hypothetical protein
VSNVLKPGCRTAAISARTHQIFSRPSAPLDVLIDELEVLLESIAAQRAEQQRAAA